LEGNSSCQEKYARRRGKKIFATRLTCREVATYISPKRETSWGGGLPEAYQKKRRGGKRKTRGGVRCEMVASRWFTSI